MTLRVRLQLPLWQVRLQLGKSRVLRSLVHHVRALAPDRRERHLRQEVRFWRRWMASKGLQWPEDYAYRLDPESPIHEPLAGIIGQFSGPRVDILDVGAGPLTVIGKTHPTKTLSITATDVLAGEYDSLLDEFAIVPPLRTIPAEAEKLGEQLGQRRFDIVHAQNSLDHSADPIAGIEQMLAVARPGGVIVLLHEENEGSNELYHALHKWDFTTENGNFVIAGPGPKGPRRNVTAMLAGRAKVECRTVDGELLVLIRKSPRPAATPPLPAHRGRACRGGVRPRA